jgi:hypothetical protein
MQGGERSCQLSLDSWEPKTRPPGGENIDQCDQFL